MIIVYILLLPLVLIYAVLMAIQEFFFKIEDVIREYILACKGEN